MINLQVVEREILEEREASVEGRKELTPAERLKMQITQETLLGIKIMSEFTHTTCSLASCCMV